MSTGTRTLEGAGAGAAAGAVAGSVVPGIGTAIGAVGGGLIGGIGGYIAGSEEESAANAKLQALHQMAVAYQQQRPLLAQAQTNGLNQSLQAYAPANDMLGKMYGPSAMADLNALGKNPMPANYMFDPTKVSA